MTKPSTTNDIQIAQSVNIYKPTKQQKEQIGNLVLIYLREANGKPVVITVGQS